MKKVEAGGDLCYNFRMIVQIDDVAHVRESMRQVSLAWFDDRRSDSYWWDLVREQEADIWDTFPDLMAPSPANQD